MNKLGDILKTVGDFAKFALFAQKPASAFWDAGKAKPSPTPGMKFTLDTTHMPPMEYEEPTQMDDYEKRTLPTFKKYGIPPEIAYGIKQAEGGVNNSYNIGATDSNPTGGLDYGGPEAEATAAAKLLNGTFEKDHIGSGVFNTTFKPAFQRFQKTNDIRKFLKEIADAGYAGDVNTWKQRSMGATPPGAGQYYDRWDDFVADTAPYKKWNKKP